MAVKSILDIEVQSQSFERFQKLFDSYSEELRRQPEIWKKINSQHEKLAGNFAEFGNKLDSHFSAMHGLKDEQEANEKSLEHSQSLWSGISKSSGDTAKHILSATGSLLKWTGLLSGVTGLLGYLTVGGITDLGSDVFGYRKQAMGLGTTIGQNRAFDIAFGRLLSSPGGFLGGVSSAAANIASPGYAMLKALGVNPNGSTSQVAISTLEAVRAKARATPINELGVLEGMYHLANFSLGIEDLRRMHKGGTPEFNQIVGIYGREQHALNLGRGMGLAWTNFVTEMDLAKSKIENVFVRGLEPLSGPLAGLATGFEHVLAVLMAKNGGISKDITAIASWMDKFNGKIATPSFLSNVEKFSDSLGALADFMRKFSKHPFETIGKAALSGLVHAPLDVLKFDWRMLSEGGKFAYDHMRHAALMLHAGQLDQQYGLPSGMLELVGTLESGMNPDARKSKAGAVGMMQLMPSTSKQYHVDPHNPYSAMRGAAMDLQHLMREYHNDLPKVLAAYNWGDGNVNQDIARYGRRWNEHLPAETSSYLMRAVKAILSGAVKVDIRNSTGGSATAALSGLGAQR